MSKEKNPQWILGDIGICVVKNGVLFPGTTYGFITNADKFAKFGLRQTFCLSQPINGITQHSFKHYYLLIKVGAFRHLPDSQEDFYQRTFGSNLFYTVFLIFNSPCYNNNESNDKN